MQHTQAKLRAMASIQTGKHTQATLQARAMASIQTGAPPAVVNKGNSNGSGWANWAKAMATRLQPNQNVQIPLGANTSPRPNTSQFSQPSIHTRRHVAAYLRKALLAAGKTCTTRTTLVGNQKTFTVYCTGYTSG